jgi:hypothetical protein
VSGHVIRCLIVSRRRQHSTPRAVSLCNTWICFCTSICGSSLRTGLFYLFYLFYFFIFKFDFILRRTFRHVESVKLVHKHDLKLRWCWSDADVAKCPAKRRKSHVRSKCVRNIIIIIIIIISCGLFCNAVCEVCLTMWLHNMRGRMDSEWWLGR